MNVGPSIGGRGGVGGTTINLHAPDSVVQSLDLGIRNHLGILAPSNIKVEGYGIRVPNCLENDCVTFPSPSR